MLRLWEHLVGLVGDSMVGSSWTPKALMANILVIDDEPATAKALQRTLETRGHSCMVAGNAKEARISFEENDFSSVLCDVGLGEESGLDLLRDLLAAKPE